MLIKCYWLIILFFAKPKIDEKIEQTEINVNIIADQSIPYEEDLDVLVEFNRDSLSHNGWHLPGTQKEHYWCGIWQTVGCLNTKKHKSACFSGKVFVRNYQRSCFRADCRVCYKKWAARQASVAAERITFYQKNSKREPRFISLKISTLDEKLSDKELRKKAIKILNEMGLEGGSLLYIPFAFDVATGYWSFEPKFYVVGFGRVDNIGLCQEKFGWTITRHKIFDVYDAFMEILPNSGVKKHLHSLFHFGHLSYCKLKITKTHQDGRRCPICNNKLIPIYCIRPYPVVPPDRTFEGFVDAEGWYPAGAEPPVSIFSKLMKFLTKPIFKFILKNQYCIESIFISGM